MARSSTATPACAPGRRSRGGRQVARLIAGLAATVLVCVSSGVANANADADADGGGGGGGFAFTGDQVTGSTSSAAATKLSAGLYRTTLPVMDPDDADADADTSRGVRYFEVDKGRDHGVWVSAATRMPSGSGGQSAMALDLSTPEGDSCDSDDGELDGSELNTVFGTGVLVDVGPEADKDCAGAGTLVLRVAFGHRPESGEAKATSPPVQLTVVAEPGVSDVAGLPEATEVDSGDDPSWEPGTDRGRVRGTASYADAPTLRDGSYLDTLPAGASRAYRVRLEFGQRLELVARFSSGGAGSDVMPESGLPVAITTYNPARLPVDQTTTAVTATSDEVLGQRLPEVRYRNREAYDSTVAATALAGYYYVLVEAGPAAERIRRPLQLDVSVEGEPADVPDYAGGGPTGPGAGEAAPETAGDQATEPGTWRAALTVALGTAAVVVLVLVAGLLLRRARRL